MEIEYPLNITEVERLSKMYSAMGQKAELVWMTPEEFLSKVPHPATPIVPAIYDLREQFFSKTSLGSIRKAIFKKGKLPPLIIDYSRMFAGWPSHEGRHRAFVAKTHGIKKVPVLVVK